MLQLTNRTGFPATIFASPDPDGVDTLYAVVKGTFDLARDLQPAAEQVPIVLADQHHGPPAASSIRVPGDICLMKPGTDVLLVGHAYAPGELSAYHVDVSLSVAGVSKSVRVFGDRVWEWDGAQYLPSVPKPFRMMPLVWERAFGGADIGSEGQRTDGRNPVGLGYIADDSTSVITGRPLPNLEDPTQPIVSWNDRPAPACFAPVSAHWEWRRVFAGTYDEAWQKNRAPFLPADFDARFFQLAPPGLTADNYLRGGEQVYARGASPGGVVAFHVPFCEIHVSFVLDGEAIIVPTVLDSLLIEPDVGRIQLTWRAALRCDKDLLRVSNVIAEEVEQMGAAA